MLAIDVTLLTAPVRRVAALDQHADGGSDKPSKLGESPARSTGSRFAPSFKFGLSVVMRVTIATMSIVVMSPFLNLAVFDKDISSSLERARAAELETKEAALLVPIEAAKKIGNTLTERIGKEIEALQAQNLEFNAKFMSEIDGTGGTLQKGVGPIAAAQQQKIEANVASISRLREQLKAERERLSPELAKAEDTISAFKKARANRQDDVLRDQFGIEVSPNSLAQRLRVFRTEIETNDAAQTVRWIVLGFQLFIIVALLLMKLFEPDDVSLYYNSAVQNAYLKYEAGQFDAVAPDGLRRNNVSFPMPPSLFWEVYAKVNERLRVDEKQGAAEDIEIRVTAKQESTLIEFRKRLLAKEKFLKESRDKHDESAARYQAAQSNLDAHALAYDQTQAKVRALSDRLADGSASKEQLDADADALLELREALATEAERRARLQADVRFALADMKVADEMRAEAQRALDSLQGA